MSAYPRPGTALVEDEVLAARLGAAYDCLVLLQGSHPDIAESLRDPADMVRFVRAQLLKRMPEGVEHGQAVAQ